MLRSAKPEPIAPQRTSPERLVAASRGHLDGRETSARVRIAFVIAHLGPGGAQRVAANAANALVSRGLDVELILLCGGPEVYRLDPRVLVRRCPSLPGRTGSGPELDRADADRGRSERSPIQAAVASDLKGRWLSPFLFYLDLVRQTVWLRWTLRKSKVDTVLSFLTQTNILTIVATRGLSARVVISERNDPRLQRHRPRVELVRRLVYKWADVVTANSRGALSALEALVPKEKLAFLPNPLSLPSEAQAKDLAAPTVVTVGRLVEQKGLDVLLRAWAIALADLPGWRLAIIGDGPLRGDLETLASELQIADSVDWLGHLDDPFPYVRASRFFVLTSRFEGTPNALLEAMFCGLPAVVSDASPGPCELIGADESAGLIAPVEDSAATAQAIIRLARDEALRLELGRVARARAGEHDVDRAIDIWLELLAPRVTMCISRF